MFIQYLLPSPYSTPVHKHSCVHSLQSCEIYVKAWRLRFDIISVFTDHYLPSYRYTLPNNLIFLSTYKYAISLCQSDTMFYPPGTHYCWVGIDITEREVCTKLLQVTGIHDDICKSLTEYCHY